MSKRWLQQAFGSPKPAGLTAALLLVGRQIAEFRGTEVNVCEHQHRTYFYLGTNSTTRSLVGCRVCKYEALPTERRLRVHVQGELLQLEVSGIEGKLFVHVHALHVLHVALHTLYLCPPPHSPGRTIPTPTHICLHLLPSLSLPIAATFPLQAGTLGAAGDTSGE